MTAAMPHAAPTPPARSMREWAIALAQSLGSVLLGLLLFLIVFGITLEEFGGDPPGGLLALTGIDFLIGSAMTISIGPLRFLRPGRAHSVIHLVIATAAGLSVWSLPAAGIALYRVGLRRRPPLDIAAVVLVVAASTASMLADAAIRGEREDVFILITLAVMAMAAMVPLLAGRVVGTRHELVASLRERAASADRERETAERARAAAEREAAALMRERDADAARVRAEERGALARDMHDSISHHLAAIAMHAGAMSYREDLPPEELRRTARTVRDAAQQANRELRTVLMTLRTTEGDAPLASAPTLSDIIERCREQGQDVELTWKGIRPDELAERERSLVVTLARILAEVTTNAAKHAPGMPLRITLAAADDRVLLTASNPLPTAGDPAPVSTGHGLIGVQERARLLGGDSCHRRGQDTFEVEAWMPW
ncbi:MULTISPECIES: sensor histidine kinase [unclassified Brachybacterium]|uniref:sensor histidine kinase n=1 Tax=unclassified Brachybacterium TaxID=2623841 RepID=UPI00361A98F2